MKTCCLKHFLAAALLLWRAEAFHALRSISRFQSIAASPTVIMNSNKSMTNKHAYAVRQVSKTQLLSATNAGSDNNDIDFDALMKYTVAGAVQMGAFYCLLSAMDKGISSFDLSPPLWANCLFFYACSLKSRVFNPLRNERPTVASPIEVEINRPTWTPPGVFFPIMWVLVIGPIRAYSSSLVYEATGTYADIAILSFLLHLSIGDIWNTVNNVEKRIGAAASGVFFVIFSAANAAYQYNEVDPTAGRLLGLTLLWLCTAGALVNSIRQLNPDKVTGEKDALYPVKGSIETNFAWFNNSE
jgi:tryptophan-rich sensory protein